MPFMYRACSHSWALHNAIDRAQFDWAHGTASIYTCNERRELPSGIVVDSLYDYTSGLPFRLRFKCSDLEDAYNRTIETLVHRHGFQTASMKRFLLPDASLIEMLQSQQFSEIRELPYAVTPAIKLVRSGTNIAVDPGAASVTIQTRYSGLVGLPRGAKQIFAAQRPEFPHLVFIKANTDWLAVFHDDGHLLVIAVQNHPPVRPKP
jgi:hypothetical protein